MDYVGENTICKILIFFEEMFFELTGFHALNMRHISFIINAVWFIYVHVLS